MGRRPIRLKSDGDFFTGPVRTPRNGDVSIIDGKATGDKITCTVVQGVLSPVKQMAENVAFTLELQRAFTAAISAGFWAADERR